MLNKLSILFLFTSFLLISTNIKSQVGCVNNSSNVVIDNQFKENSIAVDPINPNILISVWGWDDMRLFRSIDFGHNWVNYHTDVMHNYFDPTVQIDRDGFLYLSYMTGILARTDYIDIYNPASGTWSTTRVSPEGVSGDQPFLWVDNSLISNFPNRLYYCFDNGADAPTNIYTCYSDNKGATWTTPQPVMPAGSTFLTGSVIKTDASGNAFLTWRIASSSDPLEKTWNQIDFRRSTDGGVNWLTSPFFPFRIFGASQFTDIGGGGRSAIAVNHQTGDIFIAWANYISLGPDHIYQIFYIKSTDHGVNWTAPVALMKQPANASNVYPSLACDPGTGTLSCVYYSNQDGTYSTYLSTSTNSGNTWCTFQISDGTWTWSGTSPADYIDVAMGGGYIYPEWTDNRNHGSLSLVVSAPPNNGGDSKVTETKINNSIIPTEYKLNQNYPNPFNPSTEIEYTIPHISYVNLVVYDILGNNIKVLAEGTKQPGNYSVSFNASELASGIYYYTLTAGDFRKTMKMMLIK